MFSELISPFKPITRATFKMARYRRTVIGEMRLEIFIHEYIATFLAIKFGFKYYVKDKTRYLVVWFCALTIWTVLSFYVVFLNAVTAI
jgi:hypothetical protein